jgi:MFS superfamily sulfate permease-like transporter
VLVILCGALAKWRNIPDFSALLLIAIACGFALVMGWLVSGVDAFSIQLPPLFHPDLLSIPTQAWTAAIIPGLSSQLPLTITNSVLATSLLVSDLYKRSASPNSLSCSVGLMSISSSVLGGFPMCHGAGGVAAHYRFGARTGVSMVIGGAILIAFALFLSSEAVFHFLSFGILAALLVAVSVELIRRGFSDCEGESTWLIVCMGAIALFAGMTFAFIAGCVWVFLSRFVGKKGTE